MYRALGLLVVSALSMGNAHAAARDIDKLAWLEGCWARDGGEPGSGEHWSALAGGTLLGVGRTIKGGKTVDFEFMQLRHLDAPDGRLAFIALPAGQDRTVFPLLRISDTSATFEQPGHDFPQRVIYTRQGQTRLLARIEGSVDGTTRAVDFPMTRIACGNADRP